MDTKTIANAEKYTVFLFLTYDLIAARNIVVGHRDLMATACPGNYLYNKLQLVRGNAEWYRNI